MLGGGGMAEQGQRRGRGRRDRPSTATARGSAAAGSPSRRTARSWAAAGSPGTPIGPCGGGGGIAEHEDSAWLGGGGIAEQEDSAVLGGGGMAEQEDSAVLGGGGITEPERAFPNSILLIVRLRGHVGKSSIHPGVSSAGSDASPGRAEASVRIREPATRGEDMLGWTAANVRHAAGLLWPGRNPAARVYESIGSDFFLAPAPGWLNLGLWDGPGRGSGRGGVPPAGQHAGRGPSRGGRDPGCGQRPGRPGSGDRGRRAAEPAGGREHHPVAADGGKIRAAVGRSHAVAGDAVRLPAAGASVDGIISVEAAFHFRSRQAFFPSVPGCCVPAGC